MGADFNIISCRDWLYLLYGLDFKPRFPARFIAALYGIAVAI